MQLFQVAQNDRVRINLWMVRFDPPIYSPQPRRRGEPKDLRDRWPTPREASHIRASNTSARMIFSLCEHFATSAHERQQEGICLNITHVVLHLRHVSRIPTTLPLLAILT